MPDLLVITQKGCFESKSGISRVISQLSQYFTDRMLAVTDSYFPETSFRLYCTPIQTRNRPRTLGRIVRQNRVKILNPHDPSTALIACLAKLLLRERSLRISAFFYDREDLTPIVGGRYFGALMRFYRVPSFLLALFIRLGILNEIIVLDGKLAQLVRTKYRTDRVHILRVGASLDLLRYQIEKHTQNTFPVIFFHGILIPRRRVEDLLYAIALLKRPVSLRIAGSVHFSKRYYVYLLRLTRTLRLEETVTFLGDLEDEALANEYSNCDMFVFPCDNQTWGIAPLEAMLFGKPVVVSTGAGVSEVLGSRTSILVPPRDSMRLAEAINKLLTDKELAELIGQRGRDLVIQKLTFQNTARELEKLWNIEPAGRLNVS